MYLSYTTKELSTYLTVFFSILIGLAVILLVVNGILSVQRNSANSKKPIQSGYATALEVQSCSGVLSMSYVSILFQLDNGKRIRFSVKATHKLVAGDYGLLKYQGDRILSFTRASASAAGMGDKVRAQPMNQSQRQIYAPNPLPETSTQESFQQPMQDSDDRVFCPKCGTRQPYRIGVCVRCNNKLVKPE